MRRAAFILCLSCVSAVIMPVALRAAADTDSRSGVVLIKSPAAVSLPQAARNTPPRSATLSIIPRTDPHPYITEFFGPATAPAPKKKAKRAPAKSLPQAQLTPAR